MSNKRNLIVTLADSGFIEQAKQLLSSVYWNAGWQGDYMLLAYEIEDQDLICFESKGIIVRKCKPLFDKTIGIEYPSVVLAKFYLFTPEFKKWDKIIYLDADIIVNRSIDWLTKKSEFSAVRDVYLKNQFDQLIDDTDRVNFEPDVKLNTPVFNSGVFVFAPSVTTTDTFDELLSLSGKYLKFSKYGEQLILNIYFDKWKRLPSVFNFFITFYSYKIPYFIKPVITHFFARLAKHDSLIKPVWNPDNRYHNEWKENLNKFEEIDLSKTIKPKHSSSFKTKLDSCILLIVNSFINFKRRIKFFFKERVIWHAIDRFMGKMGLFLKNRNKKIYLYLKKFKSGK